MQPQQQVVYTTGGTTVVTSVQASPIRAARQLVNTIEFNMSASRALGSLQILMALISFGAASMAIIVYAAYWYVCDGFWCGAFFLMAGSAAVHAGRFSTAQRISKARGLAIISLAMAATQFGVSLAGLVYNIDTQNIYRLYYSCWWGYCAYYQFNYPEMEAANGMLVAAASLQMLLSIAEIVICSQALKHVKVIRNAGPVAVATQPATSVITINSTQQMQQQPYPYQQPMVVPPSYNTAMAYPSAYPPSYASAPVDAPPYAPK